MLRSNKLMQPLDTELQGVKEEPEKWYKHIYPILEASQFWLISYFIKDISSWKPILKFDFKPGCIPLYFNTESPIYSCEVFKMQGTIWYSRTTCHVSHLAVTLKIAHDITDLLALVSYSQKARISSSSLNTVWIPYGKKPFYHLWADLLNFKNTTLKQFDENKILRINNTDLNINGSAEVLI